MKRILIAILTAMVLFTSCKPDDPVKTKYKVTFDTAGGYGCQTSVFAYEGETIYLPSVRKDGFVFKGWLYETGLIFNEGDPFVVWQSAHFVALWEIAGSLPKPGFTWITNGSYKVTFVNNSTGATSYLWEFGDGKTSTQVSPAHFYPEINLDMTYDVTLTAKNEYGNESATGKIKVYPRGNLKLVSTTSDPYDIFLDDEYKGVIQGNGTEEYEFRPGQHKIRVLQKSGYAFYPTDDTKYVDIKAGYVSIVEFNNNGINIREPLKMFFTDIGLFCSLRGSIETTRKDFAKV